MITRRAGRFTWTLQASRISNCNMFSTIPILCSELKKYWKHEVLAPAARVEVAHKQPGSFGVGRNRGSFCAWESRRSTPLRYASSSKRRSSTVRPQKLCFVTATNVKLSWEWKYMSIVQISCACMMISYSTQPEYKICQIPSKPIVRQYNVKGHSWS